MSPRTKEQNEEIREQRIAQILKASADVYLDKGITMEMKDVAAETGLGYGTVYHYYNNKFALLDHMLWEALDKAKVLLPEPNAFGRSVLGGLERYMYSLMELWQQDRSVFILYKLAAELCHTLPKERYQSLQDAFQTTLYEPVADMVKRAMEAGDIASGSPESIANLIIGSLIGAAGLYLHHRHGDFDLSLAVRIVFDGVRAKEERA